MPDNDLSCETKEPHSITAEAEVVKTTMESVKLTQASERWVTLQFTWSGKHFSLDIADSDRVFDLKTALHDLTKVPPERQKILGLAKGKLPPDEARIADLKLTTGKKFSLLGTPEGDEIKDPSKLENLPDVINDFDVDFTNNPTAVAKYKNDQRNIRKVKEMTDKLNVNIIHPLREGKKLLVLDIDYTILDTKPLTSGSLPPSECARPRLHEFLEEIYPYYDICIWSQTSWIWLETKLVELGMIGANRNYQVSVVKSSTCTLSLRAFRVLSRYLLVMRSMSVLFFYRDPDLLPVVLDKTSMFTVFTERDGKPWQHSVKALQIIWNHFPQFNSTNTIHVDDLSRNFALNPQSGLKIHAFKNAHTPESQSDRELEKLARYMVHIAPLNDISPLTHANWKTVVKGLPRS